MPDDRQFPRAPITLTATSTGHTSKACSMVFLTRAHYPSCGYVSLMCLLLRTRSSCCDGGCDFDQTTGSVGVRTSGRQIVQPPTICRRTGRVGQDSRRCDDLYAERFDPVLSQRDLGAHAAVNDTFLNRWATAYNAGELPPEVLAEQQKLLAARPHRCPIPALVVRASGNSQGVD